MEHDPEERPLGCNGRYGNSGTNKHYYHGETPCDDCRKSARHYQKEVRRGQKYPRMLLPCGTMGAAKRHYARGEPLDAACKQAEYEYNAQPERRAAANAAERERKGKLKGNKGA